jgi:hypothetical protein
MHLRDTVTFTLPLSSSGAQLKVATLADWTQIICSTNATNDKQSCHLFLESKPAEGRKCKNQAFFQYLTCAYKLKNKTTSYFNPIHAFLNDYCKIMGYPFKQFSSHSPNF